MPNGTLWPVHILVASETKVLWSIGLFDIFKDIYSRWQLPSNEALVGIEVGIFVNAGVGSWQPLLLYLNATLTPSPNDLAFLQLPAVVYVINVVQGLTGTPNIMMIIKSIKPLISVLEEYSYFVLLTHRNRLSSIIYEFCFNVTWRRW